MKINLLNNYQLHIYINRQYKREGISSQDFEEPSKHILLWDFDEAKIEEIIYDLTALQFTYELPTIYIVESSKGHFHAYSFCSRTLKELVHILSDTPNICEDYLKLGMVRGYFTLRISDRESDKLQLIKMLPSVYPDEMPVSKVTLNEYLTYNKGGKKNA